MNFKRYVISVLVILLFSNVFVQQAYAYTGVPSYFAAEIEQSDNQWGIIPESLQDKDLGMQITRGEFCQIVLLAYQNLQGSAMPETDSQQFPDTDSIYVNFAHQLGIVSGYPDGTFREDSLITRQEIFKMIYNFMIACDDRRKLRTLEARKILSYFTDTGDLYDWSFVPTAQMVKMGIVKGTPSGELEPYSYTTSAQAIALVYRTLYSSISSGNSLTDLGNNDQKYILVYGSLDSPVYQNADEASSHMASIQVNVWHLEADGSKTTKTVNLIVNEAIKDYISAIFLEIYEGEERFPIKAISAYAWRSNTASQHCQGLAVDINPNENYMIRSDGTTVSGSFWQPGTNPYSIHEDGDVVRAFRKYGFAWCGNAWRTSNDYMHFSYFGN